MVVLKPCTEVLTISTRRKVTQVRRLESLVRRLQKVEKESTLSEKTCSELKKEWHAISRSHCFGAPFLHWLMRWPGTCWPDWPLPTADWTYHALQVTRYHTEIALKQDATIQQRKAEFARALDKTSNSKKAHATVRGPGLPRVTEIGRKVSLQAMIVPENTGMQHTAFADHVELADIEMHYPLAVGKFSCKLLQIHEDYVVFQSHEPVHEWEENTTLCQHQFIISPAELAQQLDGFWKPIWQRDDDNFDFVHQTPEMLGFQHLLANIPPHPEIQIQPDDKDSWQKAIKKLKANSARGTDLISAQELKMLPWVFIQRLATILASYPEGFPKDFMHGLVCPLSKTEEIPMPNQTRPITLLPQLYRLWAAVMTEQATRILCQWIPLDVTGLLPGRGANATAYATQFAIEQARHKHAKVSGVTLDLIKCFNCIRWDFGFHALCALGFPKKVLLIWIGSLRALTRHWLLQNQTFEAGPGTTGFPEGDQFSVLVMVSVATAWCTYARGQLIAQHSTTISAYADNWSWTLDLVDNHLPMVKATLEITQSAGVAIDWHKTWSCATCKSTAAAIQEYVQQCLPGQKIQHKASAADLGFQLQYSGRNTLGIMTSRMQKGFKRLERLQAMPHQLTVKEIMLRTSIYPATLHGSEIKPPSGEHLQTLRSKAAHALFGSCNSLSPAIALACTNKTILDPEYWLIFKSLITARSFWLYQKPDSAMAFFKICSQFRGSLQQVHGPAAALAYMLDHINWKLDSQGKLQVTAFLAFPLLHMSVNRIARFLQDAWMDKLVIMHSARTKWYHFPDIACTETVNVLAKFPDPKRWLLIREIAGAYQTAAQKKRWLSTATGMCEHCQQEDSRIHRLLECPIGSDARAQYQSVINQWQEDESLMPAFPVVTVHPDLEAMQLVLFHQAPPIWGQAILELVENMQQDETQMHWFTDGSCSHPSDPHARHAAFAIVLDLCTTDEQRCLIAEQTHDDHATPSFQVACVARCQGEQDILRAETAAIICIAEKIGQGIIRSDSQVAISNIQRTLQAATVKDFLMCEHFDLLFHLWCIRDRVNITLRKVKSHQNIKNIHDPLLKYWSIGNNYVDRVAQHACLHMESDFVSKMDQIHRDNEKDKADLENIFHLHLELQDVRARASANKDSGDKVTRHDYRSLQNAYSSWLVIDTPYSFQEADLQFLQHSSFGEAMATLTYNWLRQLVWPATDNGPLNCKTGITWVELSLSWMFYNKQFVPCLRKDHLGIMRLCFVSGYQAAKERGMSFTECGTMIQKMIDNTCASLPQQIIPANLVRGKVSSLYRLGSNRWHQGFSVRPQMPCQDKVVQLLANTFSGCMQGLNGTPEVPVELGSDSVGKGTWAHRVSLAKTAMVKTRKSRLALN